MASQCFNGDQKMTREEVMAYAKANGFKAAVLLGDKYWWPSVFDEGCRSGVLGFWPKGWIVEFKGEYLLSDRKISKRRFEDFSLWIRALTHANYFEG
jgi:hypothetical protein